MRRICYSALRVLAAATLLAGCASCERLGLNGDLLPFHKESAAEESPLALSIALDGQEFKPGAVVHCDVILTNRSDEAVAGPPLDHTSVSFSIVPKKKDGEKEARFAEPVFSPKEQTGGELTLKPGETRQRTFLFTVLALERGSYIFRAAYAPSTRGNPRILQRVYAKPVAFKVAGEKAIAHRYVDGLLAEDDAIVAAIQAAGGETVKSEAMLVTDEKGFKKWWVNLTGVYPLADGAATAPAGPWGMSVSASASAPASSPASVPASGPASAPASGPASASASSPASAPSSAPALTWPSRTVKSYFVDPYYGKVWQEAKPFPANMRRPESAPAKGFQAFRGLRKGGD